MITEIQMKSVASFINSASLKTDKRINLIYGLNGVGKSTLSNFLYTPNDGRFSGCKLVHDQEVPVLVYNQKFIKENFHDQDCLRGIFSLSKENREVEESLAQFITRQAELLKLSNENVVMKKQVSDDFAKQKQMAVNKVWEIKTNYSGGERLLEYCLEGLMGNKEKLFDYLLAVEKPPNEPTKGIEDIRKEVEGFTSSSNENLPEVAPLRFDAKDVETDLTFSSVILGNADSEVATLIDQLGCADWVKRGIGYIREDIGDTPATCPFCQQNTISTVFLAGIRSYFDDSYHCKMTSLEKMRAEYLLAMERLPNFTDFTCKLLSKENEAVLVSKYHAIVRLMKNNLAIIDQKISNPRLPVSLISSADEIDSFNQIIEDVNSLVRKNIENIKNRTHVKEKLKQEFWSNLRWQYEQTVGRFQSDLGFKKKREQDLDAEAARIRSELDEVKEQIAGAQKKTVNVDEAIAAINSGLVDLGIDGFRIEKYEEKFYRVVRPGEPSDTFHTLSEGEKMMISFLYFCELCKGKSGPDDSASHRIVVIDDPISSLSHLFVFNVGQLIQKNFFRNERFSQVFVLTHSLYFFYELTDTKQERRKQDQKLFRIDKSPQGSYIQEMRYEEIKNDYHAYWSIVNNPSLQPALIANCMRNIIEYFFGFVRNKDLNEVFQMPELQPVKYQAFRRYINRESHSVGQNVFDFKEFNYEDFVSGLKLVFELTGYKEHFLEMVSL